MIERSSYSSAPFVLAVSCLLLFLLSAVSGLMVAYDWTLAIGKFLALLTGIVAAICIACVGSFYWRATLPVALGFALLMVASNLPQVMQPPRALTSLVDQLGEPLVILLPLSAGWLATFHQKDRMATSFLLEGSCAILLIGAAIFLAATGDLSSGVALLTSAAVMTWLIAQQHKLLWRQKWPIQINRLIFSATVFLLLVYGWSIASPTASADIGQWMPSMAEQRWQRYHDFLAIIGDYPFTGSGLAVSDMVYSSYLFLVQVPFLAQSHNLFLQLAVEQGIPGLIAFVGLLIAALWAAHQTLMRCASSQKGEPQIFLLAVAASGTLIAIIVNGLLDADLYSGSFVALVFVPLGVVWALYFAVKSYPLALHELYDCNELSSQQGLAPSSPWLRWIGICLAAFAPLLLVAATFLIEGSLAALYANAGAIAQTQAELSLYEWPQMPMQDQVRRTDPQQLTLAERFYNSAIAVDPYNVTAHWRLGQIELSQGDYTNAEQHLAQAYALAPQQRAVRQLLGEIYAVQGKSAQAIQLWRPLDLGQNQLQLRLWWYQMIGDSTRARNFQETLRIYEQTACCL